MQRSGGTTTKTNLIARIRDYSKTRVDAGGTPGLHFLCRQTDDTDRQKASWLRRDFLKLLRKY